MAPPDTEIPLSYPHKNGAYTYRVPTPPRIVVPPPALNADALPDIHLGASSVLPHPGEAYSKLVTQNAVLEWNYERRRDAQMILPYIYLGPMTVAKDEAWLKSTGITMVLGVRQKHDAFKVKLMDGAMRRVEGWGIQAETIDLRDLADLIHAFPQTTALINHHLASVHAQTGQLGKVLVFCESGNERSAGVVAAYLMETHEDVDFIKAMQLCQAQRFCVNFDDAMKRLLQGYWDILCAKRAVAGYNAGGAANQGTMPAKSKRGLERDDDEEMDMDGDDVERFGGRSFAPFVDQPL